MNGFLIMLLGILVGCAFIGLLVAYVFLVSYSVVLGVVVLAALVCVWGWLATRP